MPKKGQALVEFIIILPIVLLMFLGIIDLGRIMYTKIILEDKITEVVDLYEKGKNEAEIKEQLALNNVELKFKNDNKYLDITLTQDLDILTPGLNLILNDPYQLVVTRSKLNE